LTTRSTGGGVDRLARSQSLDRGCQPLALGRVRRLLALLELRHDLVDRDAGTRDAVDYVLASLTLEAHS